MEVMGIYPEINRQGMKITTHLYQLAIPRGRMGLFESDIELESFS
jgi:hypothetical protein